MEKIGKKRSQPHFKLILTGYGDLVRRLTPFFMDSCVPLSIFKSRGQLTRILEWRRVLSVFLLLVCLFFTDTRSAFAAIDDDRYDGNIFVVYAGNGSLIPAKATLAQALAQHKPALLTFYVDDSSDCKKYTIVVSRLQSFYGKAAEIIPVRADDLSFQETYSPKEPGVLLFWECSPSRGYRSFGKSRSQ